MSLPSSTPQSHFQRTGGDQVGVLQLELEKLGFKSWLDNKATDLTKQGMRNGIEGCGVFLLFNPVKPNIDIFLAFFAFFASCLLSDACLLA